MLMHAPWCGRDSIEGARVLDVFAGTGAFGLEALSRGAAYATFIENAPAALRALRANIANCRAEDHAFVVENNTLGVPSGQPSTLVFLDPPYGQDLVPQALNVLTARNWVASGALIIIETARSEVPFRPGETDNWSQLAERYHGSARITVWRAAS